MKSFTFKNPNAPATIKQRLLLRRLTGVDNTKQKFTMKSISKAIDIARQNPVKKTVKAQTVKAKIVTLKIGNKTVRAQLIG